MKTYRTEVELARIVAEAPEGPGVYLVRDAAGECLYVGKSISIRKRMADHLRGAGEGVEKEELIMGGLATAEYLLTASELEALILENTLIKKHQPRYNVLLRDDKTYPYIRIDPREDFPRATVVRRRPDDGARYFGPYVSVRAMRRTLHWAGALFPLRKCEEEAIPKRRRPCLNFEMGRCLGPCTGEVSREAYHEVVDELILFLKGKHLTLRNMLETRMGKASGELRFEEAARYRDRLREMEVFAQRQAVFGTALPSADAVGLALGPGGWVVYVLSVREGHVSGGEPHFLKADPSVGEEEVLGQFLERYYADSDDLPGTVLVPVDIPERELLERFLAVKAGHRVSLTNPGRGRGVELLLMARKNALSLTRRKGRRVVPPDAPHWRPVGLEEVPRRIEVYDASSTAGRDAVVGMVLWEEGVFRKSGYRRFMVKAAPGSDDYASIREAVRRRLVRIGRGEEPAPGLILVDGGAGHVSAVAGELAGGKGTPIPLVGISKGERRREGDRLHLLDGTSPDLSPMSPLVRFLGSLRDEVHRYAVRYHRLRRGAAMTASSLDGVKGLGPRRRAILVEHFGDPRAVARATLEDLLAVPGIPAEVARAVHEYFRASRAPSPRREERGGKPE